MTAVADLPLVVLLLAAGAAARLTRLAVADTVTGPARHWINHVSYVAPRPIRAAASVLDTLLACAWCAGFWISVAVAASAVTFGHTPLWQVIALALTYSYLVGREAANIEDRTDT